MFSESAKKYKNNKKKLCWYLNYFLRYCRLKVWFPCRFSVFFSRSDQGHFRSPIKSKVSITTEPNWTQPMPAGQRAQGLFTNKMVLFSLISGPPKVCKIFNLSDGNNIFWGVSNFKWQYLKDELSKCNKIWHVYWRYIIV